MKTVLNEIYREIYKETSVNLDLELIQNTIYLLSQLGLNVGEYFFHLNEKNKLESFQLGIDFTKNEINEEIEFSEFAKECFTFFKKALSKFKPENINMGVESLAYTHYLKHIMRMIDNEIFNELTKTHSLNEYMIKPHNHFADLIYLAEHWTLENPKDELRTLLKAINFQLELRKVDYEKECYSVTIPFTDKANDYLEVYIVKEDENNYRISDDKETRNFSFETDFKDNLKKLPSNDSILEKDDELYMLTNKTRLETDLLTFLKYMIILNN